MSQDAKKDEFRKYLEKAGVLELLTKSLVQLYEEPEKPSDALSYLKNTVGGSADDKTVIEKLKAENEELKAKVKELEASQSSLQLKISEFESKSGSEAVVDTESTAMEASTPAEDVTTTPPTAAADPQAPEEGVKNPEGAIGDEPMETETAAAAPATETPVSTDNEPGQETPAVVPPSEEASVPAPASE